MAIPEFQSIMLPLLKYSADQKEHSMRNSEIYIIDYFKLSEIESKQRTPSGLQRTVYNRIHWAKTDLIKAGLLMRIGRLFKITPLGLNLLKESPNRIDRAYLAHRFPEFAEYRNQRNIETIPEQINEFIVNETQTPQEMLEYGYQQIRKNLSQEILIAVKEASPDFFEKLAVELLVKLGYGGTLADAGKAIGKSGDEGIDGIIKEDKLGLDIIYIQAKRWEGTVGRPEIQRFIGALTAKRANKGVFLTTSSFTPDAKTCVENIPQKIVLVDGIMLTQLMIENNIGVSNVISYEIKKVDSDYFIEE